MRECSTRALMSIAVFAALLLTSCAIRRGNIVLREERKSDGSIVDYRDDLHVCEEQQTDDASEPWYTRCIALGDHYLLEDPHVALGWLRKGCLAAWQADHDSHREPSWTAQICGQDTRITGSRGYLNDAIQLARTGALSETELKTVHEDAAMLCRGQRENNLDDRDYCALAAQLSPIARGKVSFPGEIGERVLSCETERPAAVPHDPEWWMSCWQAGVYAFREGDPHLGLGYLAHGCAGAWQHRARSDSGVCKVYFDAVFGDGADESGRPVSHSAQFTPETFGNENVKPIPVLSAKGLTHAEEVQMRSEWIQICRDETSEESPVDARWLLTTNACEHAARTLRELEPTDINLAHDLARAGCGYHARFGTDAYSCILLKEAYGENTDANLKQGQQSNRALLAQVEAHDRALDERQEEERRRQQERDDAGEQAREEDRRERHRREDEREAREAARNQALHESIDNAIGSTGSRRDSIGAAQQDAQRQLEQTRERIAQQQVEREREQRDRQQRQVAAEEAQHRQAQEIAAEQRKQADAQAEKRAEEQRQIAEREQQEAAARVQQAQERQRRREQALSECKAPPTRATEDLVHAVMEDRQLDIELTRVAQGCFPGDRLGPPCEQRRRDCEEAGRVIRADQKIHSEYGFLSDIQNEWLGQKYAIADRLALAPMPENSFNCQSSSQQAVSNAASHREDIALHHQRVISEWNRWRSWAEGVTNACVVKARQLP